MKIAMPTAILLAMLCPAATYAAPATKCTIGGETVYSDTLCNGLVSSTIPSAPAPNPTSSATNPAAQKYSDEAALLRSTANAKTLCQNYYLTASGYDRLSIKYPDDPGYRAKAVAKWNQYHARCR